MARPPPYIQPCLPTLRPSLPKGDNWTAEVKFDGWRIQLHKSGKDVAVYSRGGHDYIERFHNIAAVLMTVPAHSVILDGELVVPGADDCPDFYSLTLRRYKPTDLCVWAFDLLLLNGRDLRPLALVERRAQLGTLLKSHPRNRLRLSESFSDPARLFDECERRGLEGVVLKRKDAPYRSGKAKRWIKVKYPTWRTKKKPGAVPAFETN